MILFSNSLNTNADALTGVRTPCSLNHCDMNVKFISGNPKIEKCLVLSGKYEAVIFRDSREQMPDKLCSQQRTGIAIPYKANEGRPSWCGSWLLYWVCLGPVFFSAISSSVNQRRFVSAALIEAAAAKMEND